MKFRTEQAYVRAEPPIQRMKQNKIPATSFGTALGLFGAALPLAF